LSCGSANPIRVLSGCHSLVRRLAVIAACGLSLTACSELLAKPAQNSPAPVVARQLPIPAQQRTGPDFLPHDRGWQLVWSDEFDGETLDATKWKAEVSCWGGGNNERQCYTERENNVQVVNGLLRLIAQKEEWTGTNMPPELSGTGSKLKTQPYTSGKIRSLGLADWKYGRFSARLKLPKGQGSWPALWMMPADNDFGRWPLSGEIDIMEAVNLGALCEECGEDKTENHTQGALHFGDVSPNNHYLVERTSPPDGGSPGDGFHIYTIEWGEGRIQWFIDDVLFMRADAKDWYTTAPEAAGNPNAPFNRPFYIMLNLAVGGNLSVNSNEGGIGPKTFPAEIQADWFRIYQCETDPKTGRACMDESSMD
jgi:beta-glucanase (GH16 family)